MSSAIVAWSSATTQISLTARSGADDVVERGGIRRTAFLSAPSGDFITGTVVEVAGGQGIWGEYWAIGKPDWYMIDERPEGQP